jgi:uncharacterized protein (TIGR03067 family)
MKTVRQLLFVLLFLAGIGLVQAGDGDKGEDELQGTWELKEIISDGKLVSEVSSAGLTLVVEGDKMTFIAPDDNKGIPYRKWSFESDRTTNPKKITTWNLGYGGVLGEQYAGIYKIEGDKLTLCILVGRSTITRPTTFESKPGSKQVMYTLHRAKP